MVYINGVLINSNPWHCLMMCITLINGLVLINAYIGVNHRLQNLLMQEEELKNLNQSDIKPHDFSKQESLTKDVMGFIIGTVQPLSIIEDPDFINMINGF